jgi:hypothetical protein
LDESFDEEIGERAPRRIIGEQALGCHHDEWKSQAEHFGVIQNFQKKLETREERIDTAGPKAQIGEGHGGHGGNKC